MVQRSGSYTLGDPLNRTRVAPLIYEIAVTNLLKHTYIRKIIVAATMTRALSNAHILEKLERVGVNVLAEQE